MSIVAVDGKTHEMCHFDFTQGKWICPFEDMTFSRNRVEYWFRPYQEKIFVYVDDSDDLNDEEI
jgi:hypothetical protein